MASTRFPVVNLPLTCKSAEAFLGAVTNDFAGNTAWLESTA
jgi:hypothetical protein